MIWSGLIFVIGGVAVILLNWIWDLMTGQCHARLVRDLDEYKASRENEQLIQQYLESGFPRLGRSEIWDKMGWLWKETRGWVLRSRSVVAFLLLGGFGLLYTYVWVKTLLFPRSKDLRLLLGGRALLLYAAQRETQEDD